MPDSGPTTTGSIVAKLSMDRAVWLADKEKTQADAREIGALNPKVRIDVDTAAAMAQLEALRVAAQRAGAVNTSTSLPAGPSAGAAARVDAVAAAERRLAASVSAADSAYARAQLAQLRLDEVREKGITTGSRLAAAELAVTEAMKRLDAANEKASLSETALTAAQEKAARAAVEKAAAEEAAANATVQANEANKTSVTRMGLITSAIGLLLPLLVPVAAGAIGIAGALTMMGAAGVLAVVGIRREMQQGTEAGNAYRDGLVGMRQDMNQLAQTSALNMLSSFRRVAGDLSGAMPMLNREVGEFSGILGRSGANLFEGGINGLRVLEPLLLSAGVYVERLTRQFDAWTQNGGLQKFAGYAITVLPQVEHVLGALATAVMHILEALAPLGQVGMAVLTGISDGINGIPVEVLGSLIGAVTWGMLAFKAWGFIAPMLSGIASAMGAVGAATTIATGPIGWVVAGLAALAAIVSVATLSTQNATQAQRDYTTAIQEDTGAIGENVRAQAAKNLQDVGAFANAKQLGISTKDLTSAVLGEASGREALADATKRVNEAYAETHKAGVVLGADNQKAAEQATQNSAWMKILNGQIRDQSAAMKDQIGGYNQLQTAIGGTTIATSAQREAVEANARAAGVSVEAYLGATSSQADLAKKAEIATANFYKENDAAGLLKVALDLLNGKAISAASAQNQFDSQLANMSTHMDAAGKTINRADTLLEGMTASAVRNRRELINLTTAAQANAQAFRDSGGSAEDTRLKLIDMKQSIIDNAVAHGEDAAAVQAYMDKLFQIPASVPPTKVEVDAAAALAKIQEVKDNLAGLHDKSVAVQVNTFMHVFGVPGGQSAPPFTNGDGSATGGTIGYDDGGTVAGPGSSKSDSVVTRLSRGEEVVQEPFASMYRPLLKAINAGTLPAGMVPAQATTSAPATMPVSKSQVTHIHHWTVNTNDPEALFQAFTNRTEMAGV